MLAEVPQSGVTLDPEHPDTIIVDKYFAGGTPTVAFTVHATDDDLGDTLTFDWPGMPDDGAVLPQEDGRSATVSFTFDETFLTDGETICDSLRRLRPPVA